MKEKPYQWIDFRFKRIILPLISFSLLVGVFTIFTPMLEALLGEMGIVFTINYLGLGLSLIEFLFYSVYIGTAIGLLRVLDGAIGEWVRFIGVILLLYFWFVPFALMIIEISVPGMAEIEINMNVIYFIIFAIGYAVINQAFKAYIQSVKFKNREDESTLYSNDREPRSHMQLILSAVFFAFLGVWMSSWFGLLDLPALYDFVGLEVMDLDLSVLNTLLNAWIYIIGVGIVYLILKTIFKPKENSAVDLDRLN